MKTLVSLIGIFAVMMWVPVLAADKLLSDSQLETITAGSGGDGANSSINSSADNHIDYASAQNGMDFGGNSAENVVSTPSVRVDNSVDSGQNIQSKNRKLLLKGDVQKNVRAVNVINTMEGKVGVGVNAHYTSGGSISNLYQTNIVTNSN